MKRLFVIGASVLQLPAIQKAKEMGLYVGVADYNPKAVGIPYADEYFNVSTLDEDGVYEAAKVFKADGIITLATDMPMRSVAYACEKLGLCGISYDTAIKATDKGDMIKAFDAHDIAHPWYYIINAPDELDTITTSLSYPCIVKPTDNAGSRGVVLVDNVGQLHDAILYSSQNGRKGSVIIEEYMRGPEVSVEVVVVDGKPHIIQVTDKLTIGAPHFVEMGHSQPSRLPENDLAAIRDLASRAVLAVGIQNGPAHVEIILTEWGPKMVELGARMGGDCITTHLVPLSTGIDMVRATIQIALGEAPNIEPQTIKGAAIRYIDVPCGKIKSIEGVDNAEKLVGLQEISFTKCVGDMVSEISSSVDRVGSVVALAETAEDAIAVCTDALRMIKVEV